MQWIRWSGLSVFALVSIIFALLWLLVAPWLVEWSIESSGEKLFGAKVELDSVELSLSPLGLDLIDLQVADKALPMQNVFSFEHATASIEFVPLIMAKFISPEMTISGLRVGGQRDSSGALDGQSVSRNDSEQTEEISSEDVIPSMKIPSVSEVLETEPLKTLELADKFETNFKDSRAKLKNIVASFPSEAQLKAYEKELKSITEGKIKNLADFQQRKARFDALRKEIKQAKNLVSEAREVLEDGTDLLKENYELIKSAPSEDLAYLREKYSLNGAGLSNFAQLLAGGDTGATVAKVLRYYEMISPMLTSSAESDSGQADTQSSSQEPEEDTSIVSEGRHVYFESDRPVPDFWIKQLSIAYVDERAEDLVNHFEIQVLDISGQQDVTNKPTSFKVESDRQLNRDLRLSGELDHRNNSVRDRFELVMQGWPLGNINLGSGDVSMSSALVNMDASAAIDGDKLGAKADARLSQVSFKLPPGENSIAGSLSGVLSKVDQFSVDSIAKGSLAGTSTDIDVSIKSDLDSKLGQAFKGQVSEEFVKLEKKLEKKLIEKVAGSTGEYQQYADELSNSKELLSQSDGALDTLLSQKLDAFKDQQKDALKDKLSEKLKGLF